MVTAKLEGGGEVTLLHLEGDIVRLQSAAARPPGTRLRGAIDGGHELVLKVIRCVREGERYAVDGRLMSPTRGLRQTLARKLSGS